MDATHARTRRLLAWAVVCLLVAAGCAAAAALLPEHPASWFVYAPVDDPASFVAPANPQVRRFGTAAVATCGIGLLLLGAYLIERVRERDDAAEAA